ncbi:MAG: Fic family protein [Verrucomicrobiota bacterium]
MRTRSGTYVVSTTAGESVRAFVPHPLPPEPPLELTPADYDLIERANRALGRLDGVTTLLPDTRLFLYLYVRKEAVLSSQIEGTQSSLSDLLLFENEQAPGVPLDDVVEVSNYVAALEHGLERLRGGFPLSLRLLREMHGILLAKGRGSAKQPGTFRTSQNWLGGTRPGNATFVPPPPGEVMGCMSALEKFLHDDPVRMPTLMKAALVHVQFETIHPFLDGNGRLGRLLITLLLCAEEALSAPMLYLSLYFKTHRADYYACLQRVRTEGDWEGWLRFFLEGVRETAGQAAQAARDILALFARDRDRIAGIGRAAGSALRVHERLQQRPLITTSQALEEMQLSRPAILAALKNLEELGVVREITGKQRYRVYLYDAYLSILDEGTAPLPL